METENFDLVVVGAGWAGLIAASTYLRLAPTTKLLILDDGYGTELRSNGAEN